MAILVGQDSGCAYIKTVYFDEKNNIIECSIPALAKRGKSTIGIGASTGVTYDCEGEEWSINPDRMNTEDNRFDSYPYSRLNQALSIHGLIEAGLTDKGKLNIASGIPLNHFYHGSDVQKNRIEEKKKMFQRGVSIRGGGKIPSANIAHVYPEALAGWVDISISNDGTDTERQVRAVGLVDIGGRTTDIAVALPDFKIDPDFTSTIPTGYLDVCEKLNEFLIEDYKTGRIDITILDSALRTGEIQLYRDQESVDISEQVNRAVEIISGDITREVERKLGKANHLAGICYFGGGAEHMREQLEKQSNVHVPERPQFSNARGYLKTMKYLQG